MSWLERLGQQQDSTCEEAISCFEAELEAAVPEGWVLRRVDVDRLAWTIVKVENQSKHPRNSGYGVQASKSLELIVFTHGNTDAGPLTLHHVLLQSLVIRASALRLFGLAACLKYLMTHCEPNREGYD